MQQTQQTMNLTPQVRTLLTHLTDHGSISQAEAGTVYRIRALPRRIADLKAAGYNVRRELKNDATGQRYARYYLEAAVETPAQPPVLRLGSTIRVTNEHLTYGAYTNGDEGEVVGIDADGDVRVRFGRPTDPSFLLNKEFEVIA